MHVLFLSVKLGESSMTGSDGTGTSPRKNKNMNGYMIEYTENTKKHVTRD